MSPRPTVLAAVSRRSLALLHGFLLVLPVVVAPAVVVPVVVFASGCSSSSTDPSSAETSGGTGGASAKGGAGGHSGSTGKGVVGGHGGAAGGLGKGGAGAGTGGGKGCGLVTCASAGATCGMIGDGCNGTLDCGACTAPDTCGGGGTPNVCGSNGMNTCKAKTCGDLGFNCGMQGDGCGKVLDCGACTAPATCGGGGTPSVCGSGGGCTGLCKQQIQCMGGVTTTVTGTVYAPTPPKFGKPDPLYNAVVYIPNASVLPFAQGASCDQCGTDISGSPLVTTASGYDGKFQLQNAPVGQAIPLVIQIGKWRRQVLIDIKECVDNVLTPEQTRLPRKQKEANEADNVPQIAIATGSADGLECVFRKIGIDDAEFTLPADQGGKGRVNLFKGNGATDPTGTAESETLLESNPAALGYFDMVVFDCQGKPYDRNPTFQQNVIKYADSGGRIFASHYSYDWLYNDPPFSTTADWTNTDGTPPNQGSGNTVTGIIDQSFPKGMAFSKWLDVVGASTSPGSGKITIQVARDDLPSTMVSSKVAQRWVYSEAPDPDTIQHYTFNTPVGPMSAMQCGRVLFSDFHVTGSNGGSKGGKPFPQECDNGPMTPQERVLEFMLFDLSSCVVTTPMPTCMPTTCASQKIACGPTGDGCGNLLQCGMCAAPATCGGGGVSGECGMNGGCTPKTCADLGFNCGPAGDGCGNIIQCGTCVQPQTCGGGNSPGKCGGFGGPGLTKPRWARAGSLAHSLRAPGSRAPDGPPEVDILPWHTKSFYPPAQ